jgi:GxxExxY protein
MLDINHLTESIIGCAIEVHRQLGPGLLEGTYQSALCIELERRLEISNAIGSASSLQR